MKPAKLETVCLWGIVASAALFTTSFWLNIKNGYARDNRIYVSELLSNGIWIFLLFNVISCIIFFNLPRLPDRRRTRLFSHFLLIITIAFGFAINIGWFVSYNHAKTLDLQHEQMNPGTLEELEK